MVRPLVTTMYFRKTADWIEMLFGLVGPVRPRKVVLDWRPDPGPHRKRQIWREIGWHNVKYRENAASAVQKRLN